MKYSGVIQMPHVGTGLNICDGRLDFVEVADADCEIPAPTGIVSETRTSTAFQIAEQRIGQGRGRVNTSPPGHSARKPFLPLSFLVTFLRTILFDGMTKAGGDGVPERSFLALGLLSVPDVSVRLAVVDTDGSKRNIKRLSELYSSRLSSLAALPGN